MADVVAAAARAVSPEELATPLLPYEQARAAVISAFHPLPAVDIPVSEGLGRRTVEPVVAELDVPGFANSAMDGYALRSADTAGATEGTPRRLELVDDVPAGKKPAIALSPGTAAKVMTGAPLPDGADAVAPWEDTEPRPGAVAVLGEVKPSAHVRPRGEDVAAGQVVMGAREVLTPVHLGVLASLGRSYVRVAGVPRVAVLSTGNELVRPGRHLGPGQVYNSNATLMAALCQAAGATVTATGMVGDDPHELAAWLHGAAGAADLVVTTGGASVGEHDWVRAVLARDGALTMWRVAMKPGKPVAFGTMAGTPVLALPGNPGSALASAHAFVAPALRALAGAEPGPACVQSRLAREVGGHPTRTLLCPVELTGGGALPLPVRSNALSHLLHFDGFAIVPPGGLGAGERVRVELTSW